MSNGRSHRRRLCRVEIVAAAATAARIAGCNCEAEITVRADDDGIARATVHHDDWCRLWQARSRRWN